MTVDPAATDGESVRRNGRRVVVVGGGISGLASAALLAREGHDVTVLEKNAAVGGRAGSWEHEGFRFDLGPSWYLMPEVFDHFFKLMGTSSDEQLDLVPLDPGYRVLFEPTPGDEAAGAPIDVPRGLEENIALFDAVEPGSGARLRRYLRSARDTYDIAKRRFLYTSFGSLVPLLRGDVIVRLPKLMRLLLQNLDSFASRTVSDARLRQILGYPAVFLGSSPFQTPSMYHLMSTLDLDDGVLYPQGGLITVIERIAAVAEKAGVRIVTEARVTAIETVPVTGESGRSARVSGVSYVDAAGGRHTLDTDVVVGAADLEHTETQLLPSNLQTYRPSYWKTRNPGPSALLLYLGVEGELPQLEHHTLLFANDWHENFDRIFGEHKRIPDPPSLYVCKPSTVDPSTAPAGHSNLFVLVPLPADPALGRGDVDGDGDPLIERLADQVIAQIADWAGIPDLASRIVVRRTRGPRDFVDDVNAWSGSMLGPAHTLSQSAMFRSGNVSKRVRGLFYAGGSVRPGIGLPMCLISAEVLLKNMRGDTSTEPLPEPAPAV
ncbi:phytoene desaturase family protein [Frigoribacterium sp. 2-23]|uniref:phytoene desaturase family protein n=1 Tax=Frigoribacterium sp. 2-23 TaxID=3415006 RepID=UPI003C6EF798